MVNVTAEQKTESFLMRLSPTEVRMLAELSEQSGVSRADVVRQLIRREHRKVFAAPKPRSKR